MKHLRILLPLTAMLGFIGVGHATVLIDDTWADGVRTNWNLPTDCPWYQWTNSANGPTMGVEPGSLFLTNAAGSTRFFWTYFTSNAPELTIPYQGGTTTNIISNDTNAYYGYPLVVDIGQALKATLVFTMTNLVQPDWNTKVVRFGLLNYGTNDVSGSANGRFIRDGANISKSGSKVTGYRLDLPIYQSYASTALLGFRYRFTNSTVVDPIGDAAAWSSPTLSSGPELANWTGFLPNTTYTLTFEVARYASSNVLSASVLGGSFTNLDDSTYTNFLSYYAIDSSTNNYSRFDQFIIRFDTAGVPANLFTIKEFKLELLPLNFPLTVVDKFNTDSCRLKWDTVRGQKYQVQCKTNLTDADWSAIETVTATTTTLTWTNTGLTDVWQRFYRVVNTP